MTEILTPESEHPAATPGSVGNLLRAKREELGQTPEEVAEAIKLRARQILAMEADDFQSLGSTPHVKGFLRNYARHLGLDPTLLLGMMPQEAAPVEPELRGPDNTGVAMPTPGGRKPLAWALAISPLVLLALVAGVLYALGVNFDRWRSSGSAAVPAPVPVSAAPTLSAAPVALPASAAAAVPATAPQAPTPAALPGAPVAAASVPPPVPALQAVAQPALPAPTAPPAAPAGLAVQRPGAVAAVAAAPVAAAQPVPQPAGHRMVLNFMKEAWVEIKDGSGRTLLSQKVPGGNTRILEGKPPFSVVIGNAASVQLQYDDRPVDLSPFVKVDVARLTLN